MGEPADSQKAYVAAVFDRTADSYDRVGSPLFGPLGRRLVEVARIEPGARVLDVATGTGAVLAPAAEAAGPSGYVLGTDIAPRMLSAAAAAVPAGCARIELRVMDAERLDELPDAAFDFVLCGCAISFLARPARAVAGFRRVLRSGGTAALSRWSEADPRWAWYAELLHSLEIEPRRLMAGSPDPAALLEDAGFAHVESVHEPFEIAFGDADEWWRWLWAMPYRAALEDLPQQTLHALRERAFARIESLRDAGGAVRLRAEARYVTGIRAP